MTDGINAVANIEIYGIEVDDEVICKLLDGTLTDDEIRQLVYDGISGNFMELNVVAAKVTQM